MKHINIPVENELHERKQKINVQWANILEAGIRIIEQCGSWAEYKKLMERFDNEKRNNFQK